MGTTAQKLKKLLDNKRAIRNAITEKTGEDAGDVMSTYAEKILAIEGGGARYFRTTILLDQTITDPATMITKVYDDGGISQIRLNSHRYVCKLVDGVMQAKQLQDNNGTLYLDGTAAALTGAEGDVMMKLPQFYYRATEQETDKWLIDFVYGERPSEEYKVWDGKDFIGVYEAYVADSNVYSRSGVASTGAISQANFKTYARNRGEGYTLVKWKHHCIMAFLFYAEYLNTNSQAICGVGTDSADKATGGTDLLGMEDTQAGVNGDSQSVNFLGVENWWGNKVEWIDNVTANSSRKWTITGDDGSTRVVAAPTTDGYISAFVVGDNLDAIPSAIGASETSGFCDFYYQTNASVVVARSQYNSLVTGGIAYILANCANSITRGNYTSRLAYRGEYDIFDLDYVPAPYFEFDGTNYLDTGFIPNQDTRVTMDAQATITPENSIFYCWFGARTTTLYFDMYKASTGLSVMGFYGPNYTPFTIDWSARHILEINKNSVSIDSTVKTLATSTFNIGYPLYLGACDDTGVAESPLAMRLYSCKVYDNGTLVRDYVPMKRKRDEKVFLYDKVNNSFVTPTSI